MRLDLETFEHPDGLPPVVHRHICYGKGGGGSQGTQTVNSTQTLQLPQWVDQAAQNNLNQAYQVSQNLLPPYSGPMVAGMPGGLVSDINSLQNNANISQPAYAQAQAMAANAGSYTPQQVSAGTVGAGSIAPGSYNPATVGAGSISADQVNPGTLAGTDLSAYMNPYTQNVIGAGLQGIDLQRRQALNQIGDQAISAGAFGGSRQGVQEGVTNAGAALQAGNLASQLEQQNFLNAQSQATNDINRNLQGQQLNQAANLSAAGQNLSASQQAALANQASSNQAGQFNTGLNYQGQAANQAAALQAALANQGAGLQASLANQQAGLAGAGLGLQGANILGQLAGAGQNSFLQGNMAALQGQTLQQQQMQNQLNAAMQAYQAQQQFPIQQLQIPLTALGMTPYGSTTTGTQTGPGPSSNGLLQGLGAASAGVGILGGLFGGGGLFPGLLSDKHDKTDIDKVGKDEKTGLNLYAYRYKTDPKSYPKIVGPMAQEVEKKYPDAVMEIGGHKVIKGSFLQGGL